MPVVLAAAENMSALVTELGTNIAGLDFSPLYAVMVDLIPTVLTVGISIAGIKKGVSFVMGTIFNF